MKVPSNHELFIHYSEMSERYKKIGLLCDKHKVDGRSFHEAAEALQRVAIKAKERI